MQQLYIKQLERAAMEVGGFKKQRVKGFGLMYVPTNKGGVLAFLKSCAIEDPVRYATTMLLRVMPLQIMGKLTAGTEEAEDKYKNADEMYQVLEAEGVPLDPCHQAVVSEDQSYLVVDE